MHGVTHDGTMSYFSSDDLHYFNEGTSVRLHDRLGAHLGEVQGSFGTHFSVWAPSAKSVTLIGDFCGWTSDGLRMDPVGDSGLWHSFAKGIGEGELYKYRIEAQDGGFVEKADPIGFQQEVAPKTASRVTSLAYEWSDSEWMSERKPTVALDAPLSVYEVHLGSWRRSGNGESLGYREIAPLLIAHVSETGFTHVEFMPLAEHPFFGSWGYQVTGYFAATSRYGSPQDLMFLIDSLHQAGIGVIMDWVPAHFPTDAHGLGSFDGTHLYEHADPRLGFHPDWKTYIFNYARHEVRSFLISSAIFWLEKYHVDALRVDGVASMLYLDYSRDEGEWIPNEHGGRENLAAIQFLRDFNTAVYREFPDVQTIAEESTAFPQVSMPVDVGGLGFGYKWDMGWMHDTLEYFKRDPIHRRHHQEELTKRALWAYSENYQLPLSHDEVVHGKGSLLTRMPGDEWQRFANLRMLLAYMFATPGKKLLFMGCEFGQASEWDHDSQLPWENLENAKPRGVLALTSALNAIYRQHAPLHQVDCASEGFTWLHSGDAEQCVLAFARNDRSGKSVLVVANFTPVPRDDYRIGTATPGRYQLLLNTDAAAFGGSDYTKQSTVDSAPVPCHGHAQSISLKLAPLSVSFWSHEE
jgi:1,4-alpha-glucan branching enzyme